MHRADDHIGFSERTVLESTRILCGHQFTTLYSQQVTHYGSNKGASRRLDPTSCGRSHTDLGVPAKVVRVLQDLEFGFWRRRYTLPAELLKEVLVVVGIERCKFSAGTE